MYKRQLSVLMETGVERFDGCQDDEVEKKMQGVGFEPTPPKRIVPETTALDHSAILASIKMEKERYKYLKGVRCVFEPYEASGVCVSAEKRKKEKVG